MKSLVEYAAVIEIAAEPRKYENNLCNPTRSGRAIPERMPNCTSAENDLLLISYEVDTYIRSTRPATQRSYGVAGEDYS